jgi:E3 ubiquitin-protein ligase HUWE1
LTALYKKLALGLLWDALSEILRVLGEKPDLMTNIATALLPLIESLMVVCKHSKVKDLPIKDVVKYEPTQRINFAKEPIENLFFSFTDEHKKILNQMVRLNPNLMSGPFGMLVRNPRVLEFDNKRNYFDRMLHQHKDEHPKLSISVRRDQVFLDSYRALFFKPKDEFKRSKLEITFKGEAGVDAGGVTREWYQVLSRQMFNPDYALFTPVASDETTFHPNRTSYVNPEHLSFFKFIGRIIGKAIFDGSFLDCHFSRAVYKRILGRPVSLKDMETLDLEYFKSLMWMLENDITDVITEDFSIETDDYGEHKIIDLIPNGSNIPVTEANKHEYVKAVVEYRLQTSVAEQMDNFLIGFHEIVPKDLVAIFDEQELELLISGLPDIDVDDWKNNSSYSNYSPLSPQIQWFWRAVKSFDLEERAKLLQFATGTSKVPLNGFKGLSGANGVCKFSIHRDYGSTDRLPLSHTCFNQIDLPAYELYESLRGNLLLAVTEGHEGFGLA